MDRICQKCGSRIDDGDQYCEVCGEAYVENDTQQMTDDAEKPVRSPAERSSDADDTSRKKSKTMPASGQVFRKKETLIFIAAAVALMITAIIIVSVSAANTCEAALRSALNDRLDGNVDGSVSLDYESNFSLTQSRADALARMKSNPDLTAKRDRPENIKITSITRLLSSTGVQEDAFASRIAELSITFKDTDIITDIRNINYDLVYANNVVISGSAEVIKVNGKWYVYGVAQCALENSM